MEQLLLENFSLINKIKEEYDNILRENKSMKEKIEELEGKKNLQLKEINDNFSENGTDAVNELLELLKTKKGYFINAKDNGSYYKVYYEKNRKCIVIEDYDKGRAYHGLITTIYEERYSDIAKEIIDKWEYYGKSKIRKQYDYRGKNKTDVINIIDALLI